LVDQLKGLIYGAMTAGLVLTVIEWLILPTGEFRAVVGYTVAPLVLGGIGAVVLRSRRVHRDAETKDSASSAE
jgi:predicted CDP-diglyceride synthetase/phosphatidate cytidylyltransferase